jgi:putative transcriptional regulator
MDINRGNILVATPFLDDPHFKRSLVLLTEHNENGAFGFILNRPTGVQLSEILNDITFEAEVFYGGPVGNESVYYVHTLGNLIPESVEFLPGLYWGGEFDQIRLMLNTGLAEPAAVRFFAGYSGWDSGQLEREMEDKAWIHVPGNPAEIMNTGNQDSMWREKVRNHRRYAIWHNMTDTPELN